MKHAYAELFTAKLNDTSLVLFEKHEEWKEWREVTKSDLAFVVGGNFEYFLCLPQHKEACLHWLNGGKVESLHKDYEPMELAESGAIEWGVKSTFMKDSIEIRIKPKKENRWIGVSKSSCHTTGHYETKEEAINTTESQPWASAYVPWQFIEIEIEVTE